MVPEPSSCDLCMHTTQAGSVVTRTLLFHAYYSCTGTVIRSCTHNHTMYSMCSHGNQHVCFNSTYSPREQWLEVPRFDSPIRGGIRDLIHCTQVFNPDKPVSVFFGVCAAISWDSRGCGGLAWEKAYVLNDRYMCLDPCGGSCRGAGWPCIYWSCVSWATWQNLGARLFSTREHLHLTVYLAIVIL
jgi:hypothetical protein